MRRPSAPLLVALAALTSCADSRPDFYVHGAGVVVQTSAPFARSGDFPQRIEATVGAALAYWGGSWADLDGRLITVVDGPWVPCGAVTGATGCFDSNLVVSASDPGAGTFSCVEQTVLVHEVGHAVIGDPRHGDPRWMDFSALGAELSGRAGYAPDGGGPARCDPAVDVWRHPPD